MTPADTMWFCGTCCEEWPEPYCSVCGRMLVNEEVNGGPDIVADDKNPARANQEVTE